MLTPDSTAVLTAAGTVLLGGPGDDVELVFDQAAVAVTAVRALRERGRRRLVQVLPEEPALAAIHRQST